jgi:hypothetical protein
MAFNPFDTFRKNSKAMIAVLTIIVMFVFVLSSGIGGGDFFDWLARAFGGRDSRGHMMGEIDGREYYDQELNEIRQQRAAANAFMLTAVSVCDNELSSQIVEDLKNNAIRNPAIKSELEWVERDRRSILSNGAAIRFDERSIQGIFTAEELADRAHRFAASPQLNDRDNAAEIRNLRRAAKIYEHTAMLVVIARTGLFFGEIGNQNAEDALRFLMLLKEADRFDIHFTDDDVKKLINEETENVLLDENAAKRVDDAVRQNHKLSASKILTAIGNEYRMRTALTILHGMRTLPATQTAFDMFEYFKDRCTPIRFEVVDLAVEKYIPLVTGQPTSEELAALYDTYQRAEYDPTRPTPGFKEPRKVKLAWLAIDETLPLYRNSIPFLKAARIIGGPLQISPAGDPISGSLLTAHAAIEEPLKIREEMARDRFLDMRRRAPVFNPVGPRQPRMSGMNLIQDALESAYWREFINGTFHLEPLRLVHLRPPLPGIYPVEYAIAQHRWSDFVVPRDADPYPQPSEPLYYHPLPLASLAGHLAVAHHPLAAMTNAAAGVRGSAQLLDTRARIASGMQIALAPLGGNPGFPFASTAAALANLPSLPEAFWVATFLEGKRTNKEAEKLAARNDLDRLQERLREVRKKLAPPEEKKEDFAMPPKKSNFKINPDDLKKANEDSKALIAQFIKDRTVAGQPSIRHGESQQARSVFDIHNDPGLKELHEKVIKVLSKPAKPVPDERDIYTMYGQMFPTIDTKANPDAKLYEPVLFPESSVRKESFSDPVFAVWRIEDQPSRTVPYDKASPEMKEQVVRAWKIQKARVLASEAANKLAASLRELAQKHLIETDNLFAFEGALSDLVIKDPKWKKLFPAIEIAPLTVVGPQEDNTKPTFRLPTIRHADMLYPLSTQPDREDRESWNGRLMAFQLLEARTKPLGETVIVQDTPNMHVYVSVMVKKTPPSMSAFYQVYRLTRAGGAQDQNQSANLFYGPFALKGRSDQYSDMLNRIKAEVKFKETEELKKSLEKKERSGE